MLKSELLEIIANRENSGIEFKRDDIRPEQLAREVVALANFQGGRIILGVEDDGSISGLQRDKTEEWVMNVFRDKIHPMILPFYEELQMDAQRRVAVVSFPQGISKPYVVRHHGREEIYIRMGTTSQRASREQQARLHAIGGTSLQSLDAARLENYLRDIIRDIELPDTPKEWEKRLLGLGFLIDGQDNQIFCTIAGLLLFGINPRRFLKQSGLRVMVFEGMDKEYQALLDDILDGPLVGRWEIGDSGKKLIDTGLIEKFMDCVGPFISQEASEIDEDLRREKIWFYPLDAVREIVVNALAHRDWTRFVDVEIGIYADRFEVISPGALQNTMTIEKMVAGQRSPRNTLIMEVLRDYGYVDFRGMGIRTKVIPLMMRENKVEPYFEATEDYLKTVLPRKSSDD
ncbi:MAG: putative DNA binding domain-containing protein [Deltaproteobacteria bacterium]|nr:putative DNA binding domain-containing protein [Deltaproteobacteria bacterium]